MNDFDEKLSQLQARLEKMVEYQNYFYREINLISHEIKTLKQTTTIRPPNEPTTDPKTEVKQEPKVESRVEPPPQPQPIVENTVINQASPPLPAREQPTAPVWRSKTTNYNYESENADAPPFQTQPREKSSLEEFVGRNLISIVGIIITIIGVGIGAKYAIDNNLISPLMRIVAGYLFGGALFALSLWLKQKYLDFSAVLLSGAFAILYFITYFAYAFYDLMPQTVAFLLMLMVTIATVGAAISYNRQIIAHIGLVGAYAVPFLLAGDAGNAAVLFGYVALINFGVLAVSIRKYWKPLFYTSFGFTWLIYAAWYLTSYRAATDFSIALSFLPIFFLTFYTTFIAYKLIAREEFGAENVFLLLANSFVFYGLGSAAIASQPGGNHYLGLFTIFNAGLHFAVAAVAKKYALVDLGNLNFLAALGLVFVTLAVPVQLSGHSITLMWTAEAAILFWLGRAKRLSIYEYFSYPLMGLACVSLLFNWFDWDFMNNPLVAVTPFLNAEFVTSIFVMAAFGFIYYVYKNHQTAVENSFDVLAKYALPAIILIALYNAFRIEIGNYFDSEMIRTARNLPNGSLSFDNDLNLFNFIWQLNYSMFFLTALSVVNARKIKSDILGFVTLGLTAAVLLVFLTGGLFVLDELRTSDLNQTDTDVFSRTGFHLIVRYLSLLFVAGLLVAAYKYITESLNNRFPKLKLNIAFDFVFYVSLLWIASNELLNWAAIWQIADADKLGLSVLWGVYALFLVVIGIAQRKKYLRIGAIVLFTFTLVKLFFYDIAALGTISKTIVFVSLGILLLIISFLYNKYKHLIFDENEPPVVADGSE